MAYAVIDCSDILKTSKVIIEMHDAAVRCVNLCVMSRADVRDGFIAMAIKDFHSRVPSDKATYGICMSLNMERKKIRELRSPCSASKIAAFLLAAILSSIHTSLAFLAPRITQQCRRATVKSRHCVQCRLFFKSKRPTTRSYWTIPDAALHELSEPTVTFPYHVTMESTGIERQETKEIIIRTLQVDDLPDVIPMCTKEFGSGEPITRIDQIPWEALMEDTSDLNDVVDRILFAPLVSMSLRMKIKRQEAGDDPSRPNVPPDDTVLCLETDGKVVAIVDLSRQPPDPERNPPPVPLPMLFKNFLSLLRGLPPPDGWVTNLLVGDSHRGRGYSKVLMKAVEGLARSWNCGAIYLHVDADTVSGRIPQELYRGLGYEPVIDKRAQRQYEWMGPELMNLGLYVIDEVPLLFLRKDLDVF